MVAILFETKNTVINKITAGSILNQIGRILSIWLYFYIATNLSTKNYYIGATALCISLLINMKRLHIISSIGREASILFPSIYFIVQVIV